MRAARVLLMVALTFPATGCFDLEVWKPLASIRQMDEFTEIHVDQVLKSLGIPHRFIPGLKDSSIEVPSRDYRRALLALWPDQEAGNIDIVPGFPIRQQVESLRKTPAESLEDPRIAGDPLLKRLFKDVVFIELTKRYPFVDSIQVRRRTGLGKDNKTRHRVEGRIGLVLDLQKEVGGQGLWYGVNSDDLIVEIFPAGKWWKGDSLAIRREYGLPE